MEFVGYFDSVAIINNNQDIFRGDITNASAKTKNAGCQMLMESILTRQSVHIWLTNTDGKNPCLIVYKLRSLTI